MKLSALFLMLLSISYSQEQSNPDGFIGGASIHITPMYSFMNRDFNEQNGATYAESKSGGKMDFNLLVKIPTSEQLTLSFFYNYRNLDDSYKQVRPIALTETSVGSINTIGATFSIYIRGN
jgi:hypothetical protein